MMPVRITIVALLLFSSPEPAGAQPTAPVAFDHVQGLSDDEFSALMPPIAILPKSGGGIRVWTTDKESVLRNKDGRDLYGFVVADSDFIGEESIVIRVWTLPDVYFLEGLSVAASQDSAVAVAAFGSAKTDCSSKSQLACALSLPHVQIDGAGNVSANGIVVGKVLK